MKKGRVHLIHFLVLDPDLQNLIPRHFEKPMEIGEGGQFRRQHRRLPYNLRG